jgi:hypothetical protein
LGQCGSFNGNVTRLTPAGIPERADEPYAITGAITNPWSGAFARGTIQSQCGFDAVLEHLARQNGNILPVCPYPSHLTRGNA